MSSRFIGRRAVVTGAGSGIGWQIAERFAAEGGAVVAADLAVDEVPKGSEPFCVDVSDPAQVADLQVHATRLLGGPVDTVFNNAGVGSTKNVVDVEPEEWDRVFDVNVRGVYLVTRAFLPAMLAQHRGVIVNTASAAGMIGLRDRAAYCASKGAVVALTKQVAVQWADAGIRCNCICPGTIDSAWVGRLLDEAEDPEAHRAELVARQPMGRLGEPAEAAAGALYLASDDASFVTGTELVIDGGIVAG